MQLKATLNPKRAKTFELDKDLDKLFQACFHGDVFKTHYKKVKTWSRFLIAIALIARASDVTTHCPLIEDLEFPDDPQDLTPIGQPKFLVVKFRDWKGRPIWSKNQKPKYRLRLYHNPLDLRFCPLHWLFKHWALRSQRSAPLTKGPIIESLSAHTFMTDLKSLFKGAGLPTCSSHSIRRSAAQWARRCGADIVVIRNVGRWVDLRNLLAYIAEAEMISRDRRRRNNGVDPVRNVWFFDTDTQCDTMDKGA
jgi:hypothetical protein